MLAFPQVLDSFATRWFFVAFLSKKLFQSYFALKKNFFAQNFPQKGQNQPFCPLFSKYLPAAQSIMAIFKFHKFESILLLVKLAIILRMARKFVKSGCLIKLLETLHLLIMISD